MFLIHPFPQKTYGTSSLLCGISILPLKIVVSIIAMFSGGVCMSMFGCESIPIWKTFVAAMLAWSLIALPVYGTLLGLVGIFKDKNERRRAVAATILNLFFSFIFLVMMFP